MKALLLNGSPRQGNTCAALEALTKGLEHIQGMEIEEVKAAEVSVGPCIACECCGSSSHCTFDDDTNQIVDAVAAADIIVFATPVYWWGVTAQLKTIIDKFYCQSQTLHDLKKKIGVIVIGEAEQGDAQYEIIPKQFDCICNYLGWEIAFSKTYTAAAPDDLSKSADAMNVLESLWKLF